MRRTATTLLTGLTLVALAGCGSGTDGPDGTASPGGSSPTASGRLAAPPSPSSSAPPTTTAGPPVAATDPDLDRPDVLAALQERGGMCPDGPCGSSLVVTADGTWVRTGVAKAQDGSGELTEAQLRSIREAVADTTLADAPKFEGTCPTSYDGQETVVSWRADGDLRTAASCTVEFPASDPLVVALTTTLEDLPDEAD